METILKFFLVIIDGNPTITLIGILFLVISGLIFAIKKLWDKNKFYETHALQLTSEYVERLDNMVKEYLRQQEITADALKNVQLVLAEIKGKIR